MRDIEDRLHAAPAGSIEAELVAIALEQTEAEHGALFVWSKEAGGLTLVQHVVNGVTVTIPRVIKSETGQKAGIALHVFETEAPYLIAALPELPRLIHQRLLAPAAASDQALKDLADAQRARNRWLAIVAALLVLVLVELLAGR